MRLQARRVFSGFSCAATAAVLLAASAAGAAPVTYPFTSGSVTLAATVAGSAVMAPATFALDGVQVTVDESALALSSFEFTLSDATLVLTTPYAGYDTIHLDFASITASAGALTLIPPPDDPQEYAFSVSPVTVSGQIDATGSSPAITDSPFAFTNPSATGSIFVGSAPGGGILTLDGITLGAIQPAGAAEPLLLKADITFTGNTSAVPEPTAALLFAVGSVVVGRAIRVRR